MIPTYIWSIILIIISVIVLATNCKYVFKFNLIKSGFLIWILINSIFLINNERFSGGLIDFSPIFAIFGAIANAIIILPLSFVFNITLKRISKNIDIQKNELIPTNKKITFLTYFIAIISVILISFFDIKAYVNRVIEYSFSKISVFDWITEFLIPRYIIYYLSLLLFIGLFNYKKPKLIFFTMNRIVFVIGAILICSLPFVNSLQGKTIDQRKLNEVAKTEYNSKTYTIEYAQNEILQSIQKQYKEKLKLESINPGYDYSESFINYEALISISDKPHITFLVWRYYPEYGEVTDPNYNSTIETIENSDKYDEQIQSFFNTKVYVRIANGNITMSIVLKDSNSIDKELQSLYNMIDYFKKTNYNIDSLFVSFHTDGSSALKSVQYRGMGNRYHAIGFKALSISTPNQFEKLKNADSYEVLNDFCYDTTFAK